MSPYCILEPCAAFKDPSNLQNMCFGKCFRFRRSWICWPYWTRFQLYRQIWKVFTDLQDDLREKVLLHLVEEGLKLREGDLQLPCKILSDIDDTLYSSDSPSIIYGTSRSRPNVVIMDKPWIRQIWYRWSAYVYPYRNGFIFSARRWSHSGGQ